MNNLDKQYQSLLQDILDNGVVKSDRTGTGTISLFGRQIRHKMSDGFPLLTCKKIHFKSVIAELLWFLRGDTNIKFLVNNGCHIWDGDVFKKYIDDFRRECPKCPEISKDEFINRIKTDDEFAKQWGDLGPIYGKQWRCWKRYRRIEDTEHKETLHIIDYIDQIQNLINEIKSNPDSRRLMVNAWNVAELDQMVLLPCHYGFQVYTRELSSQERKDLYNKSNYSKDIFPTDEKGWNQLFDGYNIPKRAISLMWNQRSVDTFLGLPFNIASYGLLLEIIAKLVNMVPDELIGNLGDTHLYSNHIEQAKEQIGRKYNAGERNEILKKTMGDKLYHQTIEELIPFGGGLSEYYDLHKIPYHTKEPFKLPKLNINTEFWLTKKGEFGVGDISVGGFIKGLNDDNFIRCLLEADIQLYDYQSHPKIKAPLSN